MSLYILVHICLCYVKTVVPKDQKIERMDFQPEVIYSILQTPQTSHSNSSRKLFALVVDPKLLVAAYYKKGKVYMMVMIDSKERKE